MATSRSRKPISRCRQQHAGLAGLLLAAASGSLYSLLLEQGIDAFWLLKIHTGRFGPLNLQPYDAVLLGILTLVVIASGLALLIPWGRSRPPLPLR